jgi:hypothetical protein
MRNITKHARRIVLVAIAGIASALQGCAGISPGDLRNVETNSVVILKNDFSYESYHGVFGIRWKWTLASGKYVARKQDSTGLYYIGPQQCVSQTLIDAGRGERESMVGKTLASVDCGIYLPNDLGQEPQVIFVHGSWQNYPGGKALSFPSPTLETTLPIATASATTSNATPLQAGVGAALGGALVGAIVDAERGNYDFLRNQPSKGVLRGVLSTD